MYGAIIVGETVYYTDEQGYVFALDLDTGEMLWSTRLTELDMSIGPPAAAYGHIYVAADCAGIRMFCLDAASGRTIWETDGYLGTYASYTVPAVESGFVWWSTYGDGRIYANDALTGELIWSYQMPSWCSDGPTYWEGKLFSADDFGNVAAFDAMTGGLLWMTAIGNTVWSIISVANGTALVADQNAHVTAIDAMTGEVLWTSPNLGAPIYASTAIMADGLVFIPTGGTMFALDAADGSIVWSQTVNGTYFTNAGVYNNGTIFAASDSAELLAWDGQTGALVQRLILGFDSSPTAISMSHGYAIVGSKKGDVVCLRFDGADVPTHLVVNPSSATVGVGGSAVFMADLYDRYWNELSGLPYTWEVVGGSGTVTPLTPDGDLAVYVAGPVAVGETLRVSAGGVEVLITVTVLPGTISSIELVPSGVEVEVGGSYQFSAVAKDAYGNAIEGLTFAWDVIGGIGTVDETGNFTAGTVAGSGKVTASSGSVVGTASVNVVPGAIAAITVTPDTVVVQAGSAALLAAHGFDRYGNEISGLTFTWSTDIGSVSTATPSGDIAVMFAGTAAGSGTVTAASGAVSAHVPVTVDPGEVSSITVTPSEASVVAGTIRTFTATAFDAFGNAVTNATPTWSTTGSIGTIAQDGVLTAANLTATGAVIATVGPVTATASVEVVAGPLASIALTPSDTSGAVGTIVTVTAVGFDAYGNRIEDLVYDWTMSGHLQSVIAHGSWIALLLGTTAGPATVTASIGGLNASVTIVAVPGAVTTVTVTPSAESVVAGGTVSFAAEAWDMYGNLVAGAPISWSASAGSVTQTGVLTAPTAVGTVVVTASSGSMHGSASVLVTPAALDHMTVTPTSLSLRTGEAASLEVAAYDMYGNEIHGLSIVWTTTIGSVDASDDEYSATFAAGERGGSGVITVTSGEESVTVQVTVDEASLPMARQLAQPTSIAFLVLAVAFALLLLYVFMRMRGKGEGQDIRTPGGDGPQP